MKYALPVVLALALLAPRASDASGFKVNEQGAKAGGMGLAFAGQADDPTTLSMNLAGIGQLEGTQAAFTLALLDVPGRDFNSDLAGVADQSADNQFAGIPSLFITTDLGSERWHIALGVYSMYGLTQDWNLTGTSSSAPPIPQAGFSRVFDRAKLATIFINPCVSYDVIPKKLTFAAGFIAGEGAASFEQNPVFNAGPGGIREVAELESEVDGWGFSFNVGIHARICDDWRVGAYYRHKMDVAMDGKFEADHLSPIVFGPRQSFETDESLLFTLPGAAGLGIAWDATPKLTVEVDGEYNSWAVFDDLVPHLEAPLLNVGGATVVNDNSLHQHLDWEDSYAIRVGGQYKVSDAVALRAGYFYDQTPVPGDRLNPAVPDASRHAMTLGAGYKSGSWTIDAAYMLVFVGDRDVNNGVLAPQIPVQDGSYSSDPVNVFMLTVGLHF